MCGNNINSGELNVNTMDGEIFTKEMEDQLSYVFDWIMEWILWLDTRLCNVSETKIEDKRGIELHEIKIERKAEGKVDGIIDEWYVV